MSNVSGPYIGMIFAENDELEKDIEIYFYWIQHVVSATIAPLVLLLSGRFAHSTYLNPFTIIAGYQIFTTYMRVVLTPISALTWANLNHTLCGIDTDPWRKAFNLQEYFYFWAEFYLSLGALTCAYFTFGLAKLLNWNVFKINEEIKKVGKPKKD